MTVSNKSKVSAETSLFFLSSMLQKSISFAQHMDNQTSILVGLSSGIFILAVSQVRGENGLISLPLLVLAIFSLLSALIALFAILPPRCMRKKGQEESLLYNKEIASFASASRYCKELIKVSGSMDEIIKQFSLELYNLSRFYYQPKRRLFKYARHLLLFGILISLIMMSAGFVLK